ncbi:MAG TPA: type III-B CRISPR module RAMP protein Cmr1 [Ktedonobacteraceae bacterium]|nr:type III-B CRISPR module RAMP protein Cmr1 [Ktedonobacteraceae bacterium]
MRRQPIVGPPPAITSKQPDSVVTQVREYRLITPLYGGGVTSAQADPVTVVRATEVRGHLRFWWRACRGGMFDGNAKKMWEKENEIWGKAYKKDDPPVSQTQTIQIIVEPLKQITDNDLLEPFKVRENDRGQKQSKYDYRTDIPDYAAFPLQHTLEELQQAVLPYKKVCDNVTFRLTISFPVNRRDDVAASLWAWETFGGIGARTRRGFGALYCISIEENGHPLEIDLPPLDQQQAQDWIEKNLTAYVVDGSWATSVPHLEKQNPMFKVVSRGNTNDSWVIWNDLINKLRSFRQSRYLSNKPNPNHPGRSRWPEPSAIRQYTNQSLPAHKKPIPDPLINKFPRAVFGLPIIFQFKDRNDRNPDDPYRDPRKTVLQLATSERLASPLILKPVACRGGAYVGLALILEGTRAKDEQLILQTQQGQKDEWKVEATFDQGEMLSIPNGNSGSSVMINSQKNALQAFLRYL